MEELVNKLSNAKRNELARKLTDRFSYDKIINEEFYLKRMSPKMMLRISVLAKDPILKDFSFSCIEQVLKDVPFFNVTSTHIRIEYENADRVLIVTGIRKEVLMEFRNYWCSENPRRNVIIKESFTGSFCLFEFLNPDVAYLFKKFVRLKKSEKDTQEKERRERPKNEEQFVSNYKCPNRRVRIVLLSEDFFTLLSDSLAESAQERFLSALKYQEEFKGLIYTPIYPEGRNEEKTEEIDDTISSEMLSHTSEAYDPNKRIGEIDVETSNQGTQMENFGIETPSFMQQTVVAEINKKSESIHLISSPNKRDDRFDTLPVESIKKNRANSAILMQTEIIRDKRTSQIVESMHQEENGFPTLINQELKEEETNKEHELLNLEKMNYNEMSQKFREYIKDTTNRRELDLPAYIRKETEIEINRNKFYLGVIRKAQEIKVKRKVSQI